MDYSNWNLETHSLSELMLDINNPRLITMGIPASQEAMITEMIEHEDVMTLAVQIAERGYLPTEIMAGFEEHEHIVIAEGNRRLAALKILADPTLAPPKYRKRLDSLKPRVAPEQLKRVLVYVAPNRHSVYPLMLGRHAQTGIRTWTPEMQSRFVVSLEKDGLSASDLNAQFGLSPKDLEDAKSRTALLDMARALELPAEIKQVVDDPRSFPITTIERVVGMKAGRKFLGIEFDEQAGIRGTVPKEEFAKGYRRIVIDAVEQEKLNSRKVNTESQLQTYLDGIAAEERPNTNKSGKFTSTDFLGTSQADSMPRAVPAKRSTKTTRQSKSVIPAELKCTIPHARINEVYRECKRLTLADHPNASAVLLRMLLELGLLRYLEERQEVDKLKKQIEAAQGSKRKNWSPTFGQIVVHVLDNQALLPGLNAQQWRAFKKASTDSDSFMTIDSLHAFVHSLSELPTEREVRAIMHVVQPILQIVLNTK